MQFSSLLNIAAVLGAVSATTVSYDTTYDQGSSSLDSLACSDGDNGLITKYKWSQLSDIPRYPLIGGAAAVEGWNSAQCGSCWQLTYQGSTITILAVDHAAEGFNLATLAMDQLTGNRTESVGRIDATATQVTVDNCGL